MYKSNKIYASSLWRALQNTVRETEGDLSKCIIHVYLRERELAVGGAGGGASRLPTEWGTAGLCARTVRS